MQRKRKSTQFNLKLNQNNETRNKYKKINLARISTITILALGFLTFPFLKYIPSEYQWVSAAHVLALVFSIIFVIGAFYRCQNCKSIPHGKAIPYVDLLSRKCPSCGHSLCAR